MLLTQSQLNRANAVLANASATSLWLLRGLPMMRLLVLVMASLVACLVLMLLMRLMTWPKLLDVISDTFSNASKKIPDRAPPDILKRYNLK